MWAAGRAARCARAAAGAFGANRYFAVKRPRRRRRPRPSVGSASTARARRTVMEGGRNAPLALPTAADVEARAKRRRETTDLFAQRMRAPPPSAATPVNAQPAPQPAQARPIAMPPPLAPQARAACSSMAAAAPPAHRSAVSSSGGASSSACGATSAAGGAGSVAPVGAYNSHSIQVSPRQRGNPVLKEIRNVPWAYAETSADFLLSEKTCALFLSLKYHLLHPDYLPRRLRELSTSQPQRLLLVLADAHEVPVVVVLAPRRDDPCYAATRRAGLRPRLWARSA